MPRISMLGHLLTTSLNPTEAKENMRRPRPFTKDHSKYERNPLVKSSQCGGCIENMANCYREMGRKDEAENLEAQAREIQSNN